MESPITDVDDLSDYYISLDYIMKYLEEHNLTEKNSYEILDYLTEQKLNPNIQFVQDTSLEKIKIGDPTDPFKTPSVALTYSWGEVLYTILKYIRYILSDHNRQTKIWIDVFVVNQFDTEKNSYGLTNIERAYSSCDYYYISSHAALERYWCCFELSLAKRARDTSIVVSSSDGWSTGDLMYIEKKYKKHFGSGEKADTAKKPHLVKKMIDDLYALEDYRNVFTLQNAKIKFEKDKKFINDCIIKQYGSLEVYEKTVNLIILIVKFFVKDSRYGILIREIIKYFSIKDGTSNEDTEKNSDCNCSIC